MEFNLFLILCFFMLFAITAYIIMSKSTPKTEIEEPDMDFDRNYEKVKYVNGIVKIPRLLEREIRSDNVKDIVCIGRRNSPERIRCIKVQNELLFPSYGSDFEWKISDDGKYVIITDKTLIKPVKIPIERAVYTGNQCWGSSATEISDQSFAYHLSEYMQFIK